MRQKEKEGGSEMETEAVTFIYGRFQQDGGRLICIG